MKVHAANSDATPTGKPIAFCASQMHATCSIYEAQEKAVAAGACAGRKVTVRVAKKWNCAQSTNMSN
jgi:hypothetical protein